MIDIAKVFIDLQEANDAKVGNYIYNYEGICCEIRIRKEYIWIDIDIHDIYTGLKPAHELAKLLIKLEEYKNHGIMIEKGYYDSIDGMTLTLSKSKK